MRSAIVVAVLLAAGTAMGACVTPYCIPHDDVWGFVGPSLTFNNSDVFDYGLLFRRNGGLHGPAIFEDIGRENAGDIFLIDEMTAAGLGLDWTAFAAAFDAGASFTIFGDTLPVIDMAYSRSMYSYDFTIQKLEFEFSYTQINATRWRMFPLLRVYAHGFPEPSSGLLMLLGLCFASLHRHHTPNRATKFCHTA